MPRGIILVLLCLEFYVKVCLGQVGAVISVCAGTGCGTGCQIGSDYCTYQFFKMILDYERRAFDKKRNEGINRIISLETQLLLGGIASNQSPRFTLQPRARFNIGLFAMDFRYKAMYSEWATFTDYRNSNGFWDSYKTYDWQIISFNFLNTKRIRLQTGLGVVIDERNSKRDSLGAITVIYNAKSTKSFFEVAIGANYYFDDEDTKRIFVEIRNSPQLTRLYSQRTEISASYYQALYNGPGLMIVGIANATYAKYFENAHLYLLQLGVGFNIM
ncbi:MAG: hypothetical protein NZ519_06395 [Bacteroidia bacterium]|nr:hypothetical protein [Bacteroidia bacterium]MDW8301795.1 hypothetical protein [Bacteroidia bacterium]